MLQYCRKIVAVTCGFALHPFHGMALRGTESNKYATNRGGCMQCSNSLQYDVLSK